MDTGLLPELTAEQRILLDAAVRLIEAQSPLAAVREGAADWRSVWRKLGDLGCFGLLVPESCGGGSLSGNGVLDAALLAAERGARLQPGPFAGTAVAAWALSAAGSGDPGAALWRREALDAIVTGEAAATLAADGILGRAAATAREVPGGFALSGALGAVQDAGQCDWILAAFPGSGPARCFLLPRDAPGVSLSAAEGPDLTRRFRDVRLDDVRVPAGAEIDNLYTERIIALAAVLSASESAGAMDANFRLALEYSKTRIAFGRPIGSFQALKHLLADTSLLVEMAKGLVAAAAGALGRGDGDGLAMASIARAFVSERSLEVTHKCFQVFGGVGYTWEHDQHLFMRRLASEAYLFGGPAWHRQRLWRDAVLPGVRETANA